MRKFFKYLWGILNAPRKTFQQISKEKNLDNFIIILIFLQFIYQCVLWIFIDPSLHSKITYHTKSAILAHKRSLWLGNILSFPLVAIIIWICLNYLLHKLAKKNGGKKGTFKQLLVAVGFISIIINPIYLICNFLITKLSVPQEINLLILPLSIYLNILALNVLYNISMKKAFYVNIKLFGYTLLVLIGLVLISFIVIM